MKNKIMKIFSVVAAFAFAVALSGASQTCVWLYHQPKVPAALKQYKK